MERQVDGISKIKYYYLRDECNNPRVTVCVFKDVEGNYHRGISICSFKDGISKPYGKEKAFRRALKAFITKRSETKDWVCRNEALDVILTLPDRDRVNELSEDENPFDISKSQSNVRITEFENRMFNGPIKKGE